MRLLLLLPRATTIVSPTPPAVGRRRRRRDHRAATHTLCGAFSSKQQQQQQRESDVNNRPTLSSKDVSRRLGKLKRDCVENKTRETAPTSEVIGKRFSEVCSLVLFVLSLFLKTCFCARSRAMRGRYIYMCYFPKTHKQQLTFSLSLFRKRRRRGTWRTIIATILLLRIRSIK